MIAGNYLITEQGNPGRGYRITDDQDLLVLTSLDLSLPQQLVIITSITLTVTITKFNKAIMFVGLRLPQLMTPVLMGSKVIHP